MAAGKIEGPFLPFEATNHQASFEGTCDQCGQSCRFDIRTKLASSFPFLGNRLHSIKP
jgi:hypothetical protein